MRVAVDPRTAIQDTQALAAAVSSGIDRWNGALGLSGVAPRLSTWNSPGSANVLVYLPGTAAQYCGSTATGTIPFVITLFSGTACTTNRSSLVNVVTHELGHTLGFESGAHAGGTQDVSSHCVMELALVAPNINATPCQHEVEKIYAAYGIVPLSGITAFFYSLPIITGVNAPASISLQVDASTTITPTQLLFARGGAQGPAPLGGVQLTWGISNPTFATVQNGAITGIRAGSPTVSITVNALTIPSQYQLGGLFKQYGQLIGVTVTNPPLGPGFAVSDIYGVPQPVTATGDYTFQVSTVNGGDPSTLQIDWTIAPSIPVFDTVRTGWGLRTSMIHVDGGSYSIRVTAQPRNRVGPTDPWVIGGTMIEDFPVCTGSGGQYLMAPEPGPDAVGGC